jgi:hypothetical protein
MLAKQRHRPPHLAVEADPCLPPTLAVERAGFNKVGERGFGKAHPHSS